MRKVWIVFAVLVVGGLVAADRIGVLVAQHQIGQQVRQQYALNRQPDVSIGGFPFLTQAIGGHYDDIDISVGDWQTRQNITLHDLKIKINGLHASIGDVIADNSADIVADTATATAVVPYDVIKAQAPSSVTSVAYADGGLRLKGTMNWQGLSMPGTILVKVAAAAGGIAVTPVSAQATVGPSIPLEWLKSQLTFTIPLRDLPVGSKITDVRATPDGLLVSGTAHNVHMNDLPQA